VYSASQLFPPKPSSTLAFPFPEISALGKPAETEKKTVKQVNSETRQTQEFFFAFLLIAMVNGMMRINELEYALLQSFLNFITDDLTQMIMSPGLPWVKAYHLSTYLSDYPAGRISS